MKRNAYRIILAVIALTVFCSVTAASQSEHKPDDKKASTQTSKKGQEHMHRMPETDMSAMMNEPHHVLAMAFMHNIETFAKALNDQAQGGSPLSADFARAAVAEIRRSFDEARTHHQEHVKAMSADMRSNMAAMMKEMDLYRSSLKNAVTALEKDVHAYTLNSKQIAADCADVLKHLDKMSKMHSGNKGISAK